MYFIIIIIYLQVIFAEKYIKPTIFNNYLLLITTAIYMVRLQSDKYNNVINIEVS